MGEDNAEVLANRDEPIPIIVTSPQDDKPKWNALKPDTSSRGRTRSRSRSAAARLREKLQEKMEDYSDSNASDAEFGAKRSIQDRIFNKIFEQIIPVDPGDDEDQPKVKDRRSRKYVDRPGFSLPVMSNNFRRFNARIGIVFVFQNRAIRLFSWADPYSSLSFLATYTLVCLNPNLLAVIPLASILFFIMVPAFLARHPAPVTNDDTELYPYLGPPTAPAKYIKPAPEMSKDFFRNLRDLQNAMKDFSDIHDQILAIFAPLTNFENEPLSSSFYFTLFVSGISLFVAAKFLPVRAVVLITGWFLICLPHPLIKKVVFSTKTKKLAKSGGKALGKNFQSFSKADNIIEHVPEFREVEVFELQRREMYDELSEYEPYVFSPSPYTPLSPARVAGEWPSGTRFFEDVKPPHGWKWVDKKWTLDLLATEWVGDRNITGVEVEIEGERWVSDILYDESAVPEEDFMEVRSSGNGIKGKEKIRKTWEEGNGTGKKGEWRRRRFVRMVERKQRQ